MSLRTRLSRLEQYKCQRALYESTKTFVIFLKLIFFVFDDIVECDWATQHDPHMADTAGSPGFIRQIQNLSADIKRLVLLPRSFCI